MPNLIREIRQVLLVDYYRCASGKHFVFADGVIVSNVDGKLHVASEDVTYILKHIAGVVIVAYKVIVE